MNRKTNEDRPVHTQGELHYDSIGDTVWLMDEGNNYVFESPSEDEEGKYIKGVATRIENARRLSALWNAFISVRTETIEALAKELERNLRRAIS